MTEIDKLQKMIRTLREGLYEAIDLLKDESCTLGIGEIESAVANILFNAINDADTIYLNQSITDEIDAKIIENIKKQALDIIERKEYNK